MRRKDLIQIIRRIICEHPVESISVTGLVNSAINEAFESHPGERIPSEKTVERVIREEFGKYKGVIQKVGKWRYVYKRYYVPPSELLWALDVIYRERKTPYGTALLWQNIYPRLCQLTLLAPDLNAVQNTLRSAAYIRELFDFGWEGGWGLWVRLKRSPEVVRWS